jgi:hypothetical protein
MQSPYRVLSLGAGVDSTTVLLMSEHGALPRLDAAIFADTMAEPSGVYDTLEWLMAAATIPIYRVSRGNLEDDILAAAASRERLTAGHVSQPPFFVKNASHLDYATADSGGRLWRKCTHDYKIAPIRQKLRELLQLPRAGRTKKGLLVEQWIGFSVDDLGRTFCSDVQWITNRFPLIEQRMKRRDCIAWLTNHGYPVPPKSSCLFCPYHSNTYWQDMRDNRPDEWQRTVAFEAQLQKGKLPGVRGTPYLHQSMLPLPMAPIDKPDTGQQELFCMACNT